MSTRNVKSKGLMPARTNRTDPGGGIGPFGNLVTGSVMQETPNGVAWDSQPSEGDGITGSQSGFPGVVKKYDWPSGNRSGE